MITVCTWLWGDKYSQEYIEKLKRGISRNLMQPYRFLQCAPEDSTEGCLCRVRMFDPAWQERQGIKPGERIVCIDLDTVITGQLDPLFDRPDSFTILWGFNVTNPCWFGGALTMLRAGEHADVWMDLPKDTSFDDQEWYEYKISNAARWTWRDGVFVYQKPGWKSDLPEGAKLVTFAGEHDPSQFTHLDWVRENWV